jgi:uncharacterized protein (UPF0212 family)
MPKTHRPRITRKQRDTVIDTAEQLNGAEPRSYSDALNLLVGYVDVLYGSVECPNCGEMDIEETAKGKYRCWRCEQEGESAFFTVWDYLDAENPEQASLPGLPQSIQYRFECNHEEHDAGSKDDNSTQHAENQQAVGQNNQQDRWNDGF